VVADRNFVILGHRAHTAPDWKLDDLCGGGGRLDVLMRCVTAAMWVSHGLRRDTDAWLLLSGPPAPPVAVHFCGASVRYLNPDERSTAALVRNGLVKLRNRASVEASPGVTLHRVGLEELLARLPPAVLLDETGDTTEFPAAPLTIVLGDDRDPTGEERAALASAPRVQLGDRSLLSSACITLAHHQMDSV
jgi:tRNA (pseudouridine54-N1)-methyltransferase|tara:strand:- start:151 stop:723 length:573 start_codon:yes stop_codon:yes gene_type:complete